MTQNRLTMLLVDDLDVNRASLKEIFRLQYDVLEAADGIEALEILEKTPVDIVILDLYMPRMDGTEVLRRMRMREAWQKIPVLIKTAVDENREAKLLEMGADDFIISPFDPALIVNRVKNIMQKYIYERRILPDRMERDLSAAVERILSCADPLDTREPKERFADILAEARTMQAVLKQRKKEASFRDDAGLETIGTDVLVVSSDEVYGEYLSAAFLRCGAKTVSAGNAEQAARECTIAYSAGGFAWYVIDFDMEEQAVRSVCRTLQELYPDRGNRIVALVDGERARTLAASLSVSRVLDKPVTQKDIRQLLQGTGDRKDGMR